MKKAFITGIMGQDGLYLTRLLLEKGYAVSGIHKIAPQDEPRRLAALGIAAGDVRISQADITDANALTSLLAQEKPDEVYNLAGISSVSASWEDPVYTHSVNGMAVVRLAELLRTEYPGIRFFQASSVNIYGDGIPGVDIITENNQLFNPVEPYGAAKLTAHLHVRNVREHHHMFAVNGIMANHESPLRTDRFVFKKIAQAVVAIANGRQEKLSLGTMDIKLDWGFAGDYARAMWMALQHEKPQDYLVCTGEQHTLRDLLNAAFTYAGIDDWETYIRVDRNLMRTTDIDQPRFSSARLRAELGWEPSYSFEELVRHIIDFEKNDSEKNRAYA